MNSSGRHASHLPVEAVTHVERPSFCENARCIAEENNEDPDGGASEDEDDTMFLSEPVLTASAHIEENTRPRHQKPSLTFLNGLALVIGLQIGSGIFTAPHQVSNHVSSPGVAIIVWLAGGLLVWTGASSFIELGLAIPQNGGVQEYMRYCYSDFYGFLFTLVWVLISKPAAMAIISMVFAEYMCRTISGGDSASLLIKKLLALLGLAFITFINCLGAKTGARVASGFLFLKLFAVFSIAILGFKVLIDGTGEGVGQYGWFEENSKAEFGNMWSQIGEFVTALYDALFCYGGWETVSIRADQHYSIQLVICRTVSRLALSQEKCKTQLAIYPESSILLWSL